MKRILLINIKHDSKSGFRGTEPGDITKGKIIDIAHNDMEKNNIYETPKMEILEIMVEQAILQWSGWGEDSDDSEFGDPSPTYLNW